MIRIRTGRRDNAASTWLQSAFSAGSRHQGPCPHAEACEMAAASRRSSARCTRGPRWRMSGRPWYPLPQRTLAALGKIRAGQ